VPARSSRTPRPEPRRRVRRRGSVASLRRKTWPDARSVWPSDAATPCFPSFELTSSPRRLWLPRERRAPLPVGLARRPGRRRGRPSPTPKIQRVAARPGNQGHPSTRLRRLRPPRRSARRERRAPPIAFGREENAPHRRPAVENLARGPRSGARARAFGAR
jgi:hypothetical protein